MPFLVVDGHLNGEVQKMQMTKQITTVLCVVTTLAGCVTVPPAVPVNDERVENETSPRAKNTILAIGGALLLAAIIANEARDGAREAVRDAVDNDGSN